MFTHELNHSYYFLYFSNDCSVAFYLFTKFPEDGGPFQQPPQSQLQKLSIESELLSNDGTLAVLTKAVGIKWSNQTGYRPSLGSTLDSSHLQIDEGLAQVEFLQGSTVILEGPVNFELLDEIMEIQNNLDELTQNY